MENQNGNGKKKPEKKKKGSAFLTVLFFLALGIFLFSGYKLVTTYLEYKAASDEYDEIEEAFTSSYQAPAETADGEEEDPGGDGQGEEKEKEKRDNGGFAGDETPLGRRRDFSEDEAADPPISVDFAELQAINPDIVGWLYVDAFSDTISYPICRGADNYYYLHMTFRRQYLFSGSIFEDASNSGDFSDPNTILYGHNMKNQSMFGRLKGLKDQGVFDEHPYFWIITPQGYYRYKIFAVFDTLVTSDAYTLYPENNEDFYEWAKRQKAQSYVKNDTEPAMEDKIVMLSTCTSNESVRLVVLGKCVYVLPNA